MKTAMQELMEWLDDSIPVTIKEQYLEKEKQQIIDSGNMCAMRHHLYRDKIKDMTKDELDFEINQVKTKTHGEEYFNDTFIQNK
jgi:tagatose-1,6-bisphosphate aldolase non-catalytic subunit AgaZ/GatZ